MQEQEYLLTCLLEELAEVQKEISKALRFGLKDIDPNHPEAGNNLHKIETELTHVNAVLELLADRCQFKVDLHNRETQQTKRRRLLDFMQYSRDKGTLEVVNELYVLSNQPIYDDKKGFLGFLEVPFRMVLIGKYMPLTEKDILKYYAGS
jgi:hypothetical protein